MRRIWLSAFVLSLAAAGLDPAVPSTFWTDPFRCNAVPDEFCRIAADYVDTIGQQIQRKWYERMPLAARESGLHGAVRVHFSIRGDGSLSEITILRSCHIPPYEKAVHKAIVRAAPFPPPPFADPKCEQSGVTMNFFYSMGEEARKAWMKEPDETPG